MGRVKNSLMTFGVLGLGALTSINANASLLIEPHIGYNVSGTTTLNSVEYKYSGPQYGARLGFQYLGLMGGFGYTHSTFTRKLSAPALPSGEDKQKQDDLGVFVGYNAPLLLRAWVGYYFSSKVTQTEDGTYGRSGNWIKGHTTEIGLGFTPLPLISLNLAYRISSFDKQYLSSTGVESTFSPAYDPKEIVLGVSLPFTLL